MVVVVVVMSGMLPWRDPRGEGQLGPEPLTQMGTFVNEKVWMYRGERT